MINFDNLIVHRLKIFKKSKAISNIYWIYKMQTDFILPQFIYLPVAISLGMFKVDEYHNNSDC